MAGDQNVDEATVLANDEHENMKRVFGGSSNKSYRKSSAGIKTKTAKGSKGTFKSFAGDCVGRPEVLPHTLMQCNRYSGCRLECFKGYKFPDGSMQLILTCKDKEWKVEGSNFTKLHGCAPECNPPCQNSGICVEPNKCNCSDMYHGAQCQHKKSPCYNKAPLPANAFSRCNSKSCTIECVKGYTFPDNSSIANLVCRDGTWVPTRPSWVTVPDCQATCDPPCQNGGNCLSYNVCQCPQEYRGPQCQYSMAACSPQKLNFNGNYNCTSDGTALTCMISCSSGGHFKQPPASSYICEYATGEFVPSEIPQCDYGSTIELHPGSTFFSGKEFPIKIFSNSSSIFNKITEGMSSFMLFKTPQPGACYHWGGSHYKTFDGRVISFDSDCSFTLVRDGVDNTFSITVEPQQDYRAVNIFAYDKEYTLKKSQNGIPILGIGARQLAIPTELPGISVEFTAHYVYLVLSTAGVAIKWDAKNFISVEVSESLWNRTVGLCGRIDGYPENDLETKDGQVTTLFTPFINSWQEDTLGETCSTTPDELHECDTPEALLHRYAEEAAVFCNKLLTDPRFATCRTVVDVQPYYEACRWDYCACKEAHQQDCACNSISIFVRECGRQGITSVSSWRDKDTCPMRCQGGRVYMSCQPPSQETCASVGNSSPREKRCEEGCYCPPGTVLHDQQCIERKQCPCQLRGRMFQPGDSVPKDCNTCTCTEGQWVCTQINCGSRCGSVGDPHYVTFDGYRFDFMGKCSYYLVKGTNYSIEAENVPCLGAISENMYFTPISKSPSCTKAVTVRLDDQTIRLKQNREVLVNGAEIRSLPVVVAGAYIHIVSSIFLLVELPNGLVIWWDGATRVYVDAPPTLHGQTKGLCGTFNMNQKDDFLTPEGDIEQSVVAFANKWKTQEKCEDEPDKVSSSPCEVNVQNKAKAQKYCSHLKGPLFSRCHWLVDYEPYYQDCMFDLCSCQQKVGQCLCPIMAAYAKECARKGVYIDWRNTVRECGIHCPGGQVYKVCGNTCTRSCDSISRNPNCRPQCVEGCNCPDGQTLNDFGECIPISQCSCNYKGLEFRAGHKEVQSFGTGPQLCTCTNADWICQQATAEDLVKYPSSLLKDKCSAANNEEFTTCEPPEPITCKNMHSAPQVSAAVCQAGCVCKKGYVFEAHTKRCIKPVDCPCHHGGRSYMESDTIQEECNTCTCRSGKWECTESVCNGVCTAWGDSHFKTYDARIYDFHGSCDYVLSKGALGTDSFVVTIQNAPCSSLGVSCSKSVTLKVTAGGSEESITFTRDKRLPRHDNLELITVREAGLFVFAEATDLGIVVQWDRGTRIYVIADPKWKNKVNGLCGNYNNNMLDDFQTPSGGMTEVSATIFGDSWRLQTYCPESIEIVDSCSTYPHRKLWAMKKCGVLKSSVFQPCHSEVPLDPYMERCIFDTCACDMGGDCECLCTAIAAYAQECNMHGVPIRWRSQELCPIQCDEKCSSYRPCVQTCPVETCDSHLHMKRLTQLCKEETCVEGCELKPCPPGQVYFNHSAMECVPVALCKPVCLEIENMTYYEGDLVRKDDCHSCYCSRNKISCIGIPCTTLPPPSPASLLSTTLPPNDETLKPCQSGWTSWINKNPSSGKTTSSESERLPTVTDMNNLPNNSAVCTASQIKDIECRVVGSHESAKDTGLDAECSKERGLVCSAPVCPDFEIRVLCECEIPTTQPSYVPCDVAHPNSPHPIDCHIFYHCKDMPEGPELIEKTCGPFMMYNRDTQVCDHSYAVIAKWPHCGTLSSPTTLPTITMETTEPFVETTSEVFSTSEVPVHSNSPPICPPGQIWQSCSVPCNQVCHFYGFSLRQNGYCQKPDECISGCVTRDIFTSCPPGSYWRDDKTCVQEADCTCYSHIGIMISPGKPHHESDCETCQCLNNRYTCTMCNTTTTESFTVSTEVTEPSPVFTTVTTENPPPKCDPSRYIPLVQGDSPLPDSAFSASSESPQPGHESYNARILGSKSTAKGGAWIPAKQTKDEYLQIDLGDHVPVYGVIVQGDPEGIGHVTSYRVLHGDGHSYRYIMNAENSPMKFRGPIDGKSPVIQIFHKPVEARYLRFNPLTWENVIAMRVEVIGCGETLVTSTPIEVTVTPAPVCEDVMGLDNGMMSDEQVSVSSVRNGDKTKYGSKQVSLSAENDERSGTGGAWIPVTNEVGQWVQFDFLEPRNLTGVVTKGQDKSNAWIKTFEVMYSHDGKTWNPVLDSAGNVKEFPANFDNNTPQKNLFDRVIQTQYLRIIPLKWHNNIALRAEVIGCYEPYPTIAYVLVSSTELPVECSPCPGLPLDLIEEDKCACAEPLLWDGQACVNSTQCPCYINHTRYEVGTVYLTEDCENCVCKLSGIPDCKKKECKPCDEGLQSVLSSSCGCLCKPCPESTVLCPTSNICINETLWCDGIQNCPDDERDCPTPTTIASTLPPSTTLSPPCPRPECEPGYKLQRVRLPPLAQKFFSKNVKSTKGRKVIRKPTSRYTTSRNSSSECEQWICVPPHDTHNKPCGKPKCPATYQLVAVNAKGALCPRYTCLPPEAVCNVTGRTFHTFDGTEYKYDICNHILAEDSEENKWDISLVSVCSGVGPCSRHLVIVHDEHLFTLYPDMSSKFDDVSYTPDETKRFGARNRAFVLSRIGASLLFKSNRYGFWIKWDSQSNVKIGVSGKLSGKVDGLCGFYNGHSDDDKLMSNGVVAKTTKEFGDSWSNSDNPECEIHRCPIDLQNKAYEICLLTRAEPLSQCQSVLNADQFQSHCIETVCECLAANRSGDDCRCQALLNFVTQCQEADNSIDLTGWRTQHNCPADCESPLVHYDCYRHECEPSCDGLRDIEQCQAKTGACFPGCFCPDGLLRKGDKCIKPSECLDCICDGFGDPQYLTFDRSNYTFNGNCTYVASQDVNPLGEHKYQVLVTNRQCKDDTASTCTGAVSVIYQGHKVTMKRDNDKLEIYVDGTAISEAPLTHPWLRLYKMPGFKVSALIVPLQLEVSYFFHNYQFTVKLSSHTLGGQTEGLCGSCNGNQTDDFLLPSGTIADSIDKFGLGWLVPSDTSEENCLPPTSPKGCVPLPPDEDPCLTLLDHDVFQKCRNILDPGPYIAACQSDLCHSLDKEKSTCRDVEAYVRDCERAGICLDWRSALKCPFLCPDGLEYGACRSSCNRTCSSSEEDSLNCDSVSSDGCYCPENKMLRDGECVAATQCNPCDSDGHYDGDIWPQDRCTNCSCIGKNRVCERFDCSSVRTVCEEGMTAVEIPASETDCCNTVVCVPEPTPTPGLTPAPCEEPKIPDCQPDQEQVSIRNHDGCPEIVCRCAPCKPVRELGNATNEAGPLAPPEPGMKEILNTSGCCPHIQWVCDPADCPIPDECPPPLVPLEIPDVLGKCCPSYRCGIPPDECVVKSQNGSELITIKIGSTWEETPCSVCRCIRNVDGAPETQCNNTVCPSSDMAENLTLDYVVETIIPPKQCCPSLRLQACRVGAKILKPGESWVAQEPDRCEMHMCLQTDDSNVKKDTVVEKCVTTCELGFEYFPPEPDSSNCCGQCKPVGCVVDGVVYREGIIPPSEDNCTHYSCISKNGTFHVHEVTTKCPELPADIQQEFLIEMREVPGQCCKQPHYLACIDEGVIYQPGETWESPRDPCKNITCLQGSEKQLTKPEVVQKCSETCSQGWQYIPPPLASPLCCGQCMQVACVHEGQLYEVGSSWKSPNGCTEYTCTKSSSDEFQVTSMSEPCPLLDKCKPEDIYDDGCCKKCNVSRENLMNCQPQPVELHRKVVRRNDPDHGLCVNLQPVLDFVVCEGQCLSFTRYNTSTNRHDNDCTCCQPVKYGSVNVTMTCIDDYTFKMQVPIPIVCSCHACGEQRNHGVKSIPKKTFSFT